MRKHGYTCHAICCYFTVSCDTIQGTEFYFKPDDLNEQHLVRRQRGGEGEWLGFEAPTGEKGEGSSERILVTRIRRNFPWERRNFVPAVVRIITAFPFGGSDEHMRGCFATTQLPHPDKQRSLLPTNDHCWTTPQNELPYHLYLLENKRHHSTWTRL